jgi:glyoxylase-like metal-dependent hydrolase (beta-lactamase superfamily II)
METTAPPLVFRPLPGRSAPRLARWFCPVGPPEACRTESGVAAVTTVPGRYCNSHIIEGSGALALVDVGSREDVEWLEKAVAAIGKPVRWVIPTHLHFDHVLGVEEACRVLSARLCLGEVARACVESGRRPRAVQARCVPHFFSGWLWQGLPLFARRDLSLVSRVGSPLGRNELRCPMGPVLSDASPLPDFDGWTVLATPGHAEEAVCLWHEAAGFLISGDTVVNFRGGEWNNLVTDENDYRSTRERLRCLRVRAVFPGHGRNLAGDDLMARIRRLDSDPA